MKMVEKSEVENHFSWCCFLLHPPLFFFLVTLIPSVAFLCFLSSYGLSSLLITVAVLFVSTSVFFLPFFKKMTRLYLAERSEEEGNDDIDDDGDDGGDDDDDDDDDDGLIEIALVSKEAGIKEANGNINQSHQRLRVEEKEEEEEKIDDVNMDEEDNLIEIDISIGSIKRPSK